MRFNNSSNQWEGPFKTIPGPGDRDDRYIFDNRSLSSIMDWLGIPHPTITWDGTVLYTMEGEALYALHFNKMLYVYQNGKYLVFRFSAKRDNMTVFHYIGTTAATFKDFARRLYDERSTHCATY